MKLIARCHVANDMRSNQKYPHNVNIKQLIAFARYTSSGNRNVRASEIQIPWNAE